ncbi:hypothetical protein XENOCAPTIV_027165 [Xenoophorus captivus]|uniref:BHLH domain-containing protein n=1 Tax=Xenoophorus captivus TaxID=1517983 RepID=A0ABV0QP21_9TELE
MGPRLPGVKHGNCTFLSNAERKGKLQLFSASQGGEKGITLFTLLTRFSCRCGAWLHGMLLLQLRKPLIERKRRERINNCLDQLKETVIGAFRLDVGATVSPISSTKKAKQIKVTSFITSEFLSFQQQSKLEKADILEMTVKHLQNIQNNKLNG